MSIRNAADIEEITRLKALLRDAEDRAHLAHGVAELAMRHRNEAEARLTVLREAMRIALDTTRPPTLDLMPRNGRGDVVLP